MIHIIFLTLFYPLSFASSAPCDALPPSSVEQQDLSLAIPNCTNQRALSLASSGRRIAGPICNCKKEFELKAIIPSILPISKGDRQRLYFEAIFSQYEKVLKNNIVDISKIASLDTNGQLQFPKARVACVFNDTDSFSSGCASPRARQLLSDPQFMRNYKDRVTNEVLNLLGPLSTTPRQGLLDRNNRLTNFTSNQCTVTEQEAMRFSSMALENIIAPNLLDALVRQRSNITGKSLDQIFDSIGVDSNMIEMLLHHPIISVHLKDGSQFLRFIDSIPTPKTLASLQTTLMSNDSSTILDAKIADNCARSYTEFKKAICSEQFESGEIELDPFANLDSLGIQKPNDLPHLADHEELIEFNKQVLRFCPGERNLQDQQLSDSIGSLNEFIPTAYVSFNNTQFSQQKFEREIGSARDQICLNQSQTRDCSSLTDLIEKHGCLAAQLWRESKTAPTPTIAQLSNRPVMELIRNMLPPAEDHSRETKQALAEVGLIPTPLAQRPSGEQIAQAAAQVERFNPNFTSSSDATLPRTQRSVAANNVVQPTQVPVTQTRTVNATGAQTSAYSAQLAEVMAQKQRMFEESNDTYRGIIDQLIKRRMDEPNREEVTQAVTEEFRRAGRPFDPRSREGQSFINNIVNNYPQAVRQNNPQAITRPFEQERVAQAFEESIAETTGASTGGANRGLAGARTDANSIAATARLSTGTSANGLEKVIVNDPTLNLTDPQLPQILQNVLTLNENGEVLQRMLDERKDFILRLNNAEVKLDFDPSTQSYSIQPLGNVPSEVVTSLNRFLNNYSLIARVRSNRHTTFSSLVQELQRSQSSL